jgi:hypothetical protein
MAQKELTAVEFPEAGFELDLPADKHFIATFQPEIALTVNLCGYEIKFQKMKNPKTGEVVYPHYKLESRNFPPRGTNPDEKAITVLPEILKKMTQSLNKIGTVNRIEVVEDKPKPAKPK